MRRLGISAVLCAAPLLAQTVDFARDVEPVFRSRCQGCHGPQQQMSGLRLDNGAAALAGGQLWAGDPAG